MSRRVRTGAEAVDALVRRRPTPQEVLALIETSGLSWAIERWTYIGTSGLSKLAQDARDLRRAETKVASPFSRRRTTPAQEQAAVEAVYRLGSIQDAAREAGLHYTFVRTLLRKRGLTDYPRLSLKERGRRGGTTRVRNELAGSGAGA